MKKLSLICVLLIAFSHFGQCQSNKIWTESELSALAAKSESEKIAAKTITVLTQDSTNYGKAISFMTNNLDKSHKEFRTGTVFFVLGTCGVVGGVIMTPYYDLEHKAHYDVKNVLIGIGGGLQLIGSILWIDSHKWIGRAGRLEWQGDKIVLKF